MQARGARSDEQDLWVSAKTGAGLDLLTDAIADAVGFNYREKATSWPARHVDALRKALTHIDAAAQHLDHVALELFKSFACA